MRIGKKYKLKRPPLIYTYSCPSIIDLKKYYPEVRVTTFVFVFVVGVVAPATPLCFFNTLFSALLSLPPFESVPRVSSPPPFLREGSVRLRVTPTVVNIGGL